MSETTHTPTPWRDYVQGDGTGVIISTVEKDNYGRDREIIVRVPLSGQPSRENAAFIVRAVNAHDALVDALGTLVASLSWEEKRSGTTYHGYEMAKAALAKAEGK
ncbi:MAG: hypothetical protein PHC52_14820 [Syntrophales bacterium]|nr:hypothetical protein [Syntrophales bacterium]